MKTPLSLRLAKKIKIPFIRKWLMKPLFKKNGLKLQGLYAFSNDRFYIYKVDGHYIPNESFVDRISFTTQFEKCRNESLFAYTPVEGDIILDIGAGLGEEIIYYSKLAGETGQVIAIESNPQVFEVLEKTISYNKLSNAVTQNIAIYSENQPVNLAGDTNSYETSYVKMDEKKQDAIPGVRLDDFIKQQELKKIDLLKVNIEGGERYVIATLDQPQLAIVKNVAIACHDFRFRREGNPFFKTKELVIEFLQQHGFEIKTRNTGTEYIDDWVYGVNKFVI